MSLNEDTVKELLYNLVESHQFNTFEAKDRSRELVGQLFDTQPGEEAPVESAPDESEAYKELLAKYEALVAEKGQPDNTSVEESKSE